MAEPLPQRGAQALRQLVDEMAHRRAAPGAAPAPVGAAPAARPATGVAPKVASPPKVPALDYFRDTWGRLQVHQRVARTLARPPDNAGPLNSHLLALRTLQQLQALSPAYLARFVAYLDALLWVDQAAASVPLAPTAGNDTDKKRKPGRSKPGTTRTPAP